MCVSLVQGNPVPLLYWFDDGLVVVRAQLNLNHIDEGLGYIVLSAFVVVDRRGISCGLAAGESWLERSSTEVTATKDSVASS